MTQSRAGKKRAPAVKGLEAEKDTRDKEQGRGGKKAK